MKTIVIDGVIGWDIAGYHIRSLLKDAGGEELDVQIASPGGYVDDGLEIFNLFRNYEGKVTMHLMGQAASMASYIAMAGDYVKAEDNCVFMIHNVWGLGVGDYREMKKCAEVYEGLTGLLAKAYAKKAGENVDKIRALMDDESWYFGNEMLDAGFVDEIIETDKEKDKNSAITLAKSKFRNCLKTMRDAEDRKENTEKIASLLGMNIKKTTDSESNSNKPASEGGRNKEGVIMTLEELKAQHPDIYNAAREDGVKAERSRVSAHLKAAERTGAVTEAYGFIREGKSFMDEEVQAEYLTAGRNKADLTDRQSDDTGDTTTSPVAEDANEEEITELVDKTLGLKKEA